MMVFRSLPWKINTAIFATAVAISVFFVLILYHLEMTRTNEQMKRINLLLETVYKQKLDDLANEVFARQERALKATLHEIKAVDGIIGVSVYDDNGTLFASSDDRLDTVFSQKKFNDTGRQAVFETIQDQNNYYAVYASLIEVIGKKIGSIVFFYDLSKLKQESRNAVALLLLLPIATVLFIAILLNLFLVRSVTRPVSILHNAMRKVEDGQLGVTVDLPGKDEIGDMGAAFNDMSRKLRSGHEALIEAEEKYRGIFENAIEGIFQYSTERRRFTTINPSMAAILGYQNPQELIDLTDKAQKSLFVKESDWLSFDHTLKDSGRILGFETELLKKEGTSIWASISARRVYDKEGRALYDEGSFINITEQKQKMAAEQEREAAQSANKAKSDFLAKMSHEIRTPLNAVIGFADILADMITEEKQLSYIKIIQSSGTNLLALINDILDLSKIEAGRMESKRSATNITTLIEELLNLFSLSAGQKKIDLDASIAKEVPEYLMLDSTHLRQVLFNLFGNAVKFTEHGGVHIICSAAQAKKDNLWNVTVSVHDTGPGIEAEAQQIIFESFHRHIPKEKTIEGTGLGLAITKHLVKIMNGQIKVESKKGQGSVFTIILLDVPVAKSGQKTIHDLRYDTDGSAEKIFSPARLLIVDDLEVNRNHLKESLKETPFTFLEAENGESALALMNQYEPDMILLDIMMPSMDGYETLARLRAHEKKVPVIAITASGMKEDIAKIEEAGFDAYLIRPFHKTALRNIVATFMNYTTILSPSPRGTGKPEVPREEASEPAQPPLLVWHCPRQAAEMLQSEYLPTWREICKRQRLPDIKRFADNLHGLGDQYSIEILSKYSLKLKEYAENVEIDKLRGCLAEFMDIVNNMNIV